MVATDHNTPQGMDAFYASAPANYYAERFPLFDRIALICDGVTGDKTDLRVLEAGCGPGYLLRLIWRRMGDRIARMTGLDYSRTALDKARVICPEAAYVWADVTDPAYVFTADLIVCSQTLEHIEAADVALANMVSWLAPGGVLVLTVPDGARDTFAGHVHFWDEAGLAALVAPYGGVVRRLTEMNLWAEIRRPVEVGHD